MLNKQNKTFYKGLIISIIFMFLAAAFGFGEDELPKPTYENSVIISIENRVTNSSEVDYIKNNINFGLYAWLSFSRTAYVPSLGWHEDLSQASQGIQSFKDDINAAVQAALNHDVKLHVVLVAGLVRYVYIYRDAKEEDIRNCQWYNDNKLASDSQILDPDAMDSMIWGTLSRYARKMRANLEAKSQASLSFLKQKMDENPGVIAALSGWGEVELNFRRIIHTQSIQDYFCDYSPFAVLEFRDWIRHTGMYDDVSGKYAGEGYSEGGAKYQGSSGRQQFNQDFGTNFTTWNLKYFNWSLNDDYDTDPTDLINNDPNRIPCAEYSHGNMMPDSGEYYIEGGFDPPRVMNPGDPFWDLWNLFRETMVHHFVLDMAKWVDEAGIPCERWFSHQIPGDYLFGTNPDMDDKNPRYYTGASPLWTADVQPYASTGATIYDIKFPVEMYPDEFARTTEYALSAVSSMDDNWAIMEYDAETYPPGLNVEQSPVSDILDQYLNVYDYSPHVINFFQWIDGGEHCIKGMNKEEALKDFMEAIRDKARKTDLNYVFKPPGIAGLSGQFNESSGGVEIEISPKIWEGEDWEWKDWGDFDYFEIHRSTNPGFTPDASTLIGSTSDYLYLDNSYVPQMCNYYRAKAVNVNGEMGAASEEVMIIPSSSDAAVLSVDRNVLNFGAEIGGTTTSTQNVFILNTGAEGTTLNWSASPSQSWISVNPSSGTGEKIISVGVSASGLQAGNYQGQVTVSDPNAFNSPQVVNISLKVMASGSSQPPIGYWDTPVDGATQVRGQIPVTGWALDDIEVDRVEIWRRYEPEDPPEAKNSEGLVFVGDALFVEGARPNLETDSPYNEYPFNYKGGWGYMLLTYGLARRGNGTYVLHAFVWDVEGNRTDLGTKTITCDNDNAVKPFGTLDTPAPGMTFPHETYGNINFGWVLTPQPKYIPFDGSTIYVYIDGELKGNVDEYGNYSASVAEMFPDYQNTNNSYGHYFIDLGSYENGVHTIQWTAYDSDGVGEGIGSRYFNIQNTGGAAAEERSPVRSLGQVSGLTSIPENSSGYVGVKRGYVDAELQRFYPDERGVVKVEMEEAGRVEIHLMDLMGQEAVRAGSSETQYTGYLVVGQELRPLPIGSTLDKDKGIFYWMPGAGFLGEYDFVFVKNSNGISRRKSVKINIVPQNRRQ